MSFGSPAADFAEVGLDLNQALIRHRSSTYFARMAGSALSGMGILDGDILIVDRSLTARSENLIVCTLNGEILARRYRLKNNTAWLVSEEKEPTARRIRTEDEFSVWGVITSVIRPLEALPCMC